MKSSEHLTPEYLRSLEYDSCVIDADFSIYKAAFSSQQTQYTLEDLEGDVINTFTSAKACKDYMSDAEDMFEEDTRGWIRKSEKTLGDSKVCFKVINNIIRTVETKVKSKNYKWFLGGQGNFRKDVATILKYKGERPPKPEHFDVTKDYALNVMKAKTIDNLEVDDVVSVNLYNDYLKNPNDPKVILVHEDKDLNGTAGAHYNYSKDEFYYVTQEEADYFFAWQMLTGDLSVDNIQGLPDVSLEFREKYELGNYKGCGKVTADKILSDLKGQSLKVLYNRVLEAYQSYYSDPYTYTSWDGKELQATPEEILDENCELLFMMRKKDERWPEYKKRTFK